MIGFGHASGAALQMPSPEERVMSVVWLVESSEVRQPGLR